MIVLNDGDSDFSGEKLLDICIGPVILGLGVDDDPGLRLCVLGVLGYGKSVKTYLSL